MICVKRAIEIDQTNPRMSHDLFKSLRSKAVHILLKRNLAISNLAAETKRDQIKQFLVKSLSNQTVSCKKFGLIFD